TISPEIQVSTLDRIVLLQGSLVSNQKVALLSALILLVLSVSHGGNAQDNGDTQNRSEARSFTFQDIFASRPGDQRVYVLLGGGFFRGIRFGNPAAFISDWLAAHTAAEITPISRMFTTNTRSLKTSEIVYIWVEDREHSLNIDMVRAGLFPGGAMYDMVDNL